MTKESFKNIIHPENLLHIWLSYTVNYRLISSVKTYTQLMRLKYNML